MGYEGSSHCRKKILQPANVGFDFFSAMSNPSYSAYESPKKAFNCLNALWKDLTKTIGCNNTDLIQNPSNLIGRYAFYKSTLEIIEVD